MNAHATDLHTHDDTRGRLTDADAFIKFAFGGNATFTLVSRKTGTRYTYRVRKSPDNSAMFFVSTLVGSDNESDYAYLGFINRKHASRAASLLRAGTKGKPDDVRFRGLAYVLDRAFWGALPENVEAWHEGRCARCARKLTDPESVARGLGPECATK